MPDFIDRLGAELTRAATPSRVHREREVSAGGRGGRGRCGRGTNDGTIGALGEDGSFGDDHRFHPFSENYQDQGSCAPLDARGHGFTNTIIWGLPTSAMGAAGASPRSAGATRSRAPRRRRATSTSGC
jgi:hypothetical protein